MRASVTIAVDPRQPRENIVGGVGDQRRVVIAADDAFSLQEIPEPSLALIRRGTRKLRWLAGRSRSAAPSARDASKSA